MSSLKKGTLLLMFGWGCQIFAGYIAHSWLARYIDPEVFGTYGIVMGILAWLHIGAVNGLPVALQKFTAANESSAFQLLRSVASMQIATAFILFLGAFFIAPVIGRLLNDESITVLLRIAIWDIWIYSAFFVLMALQNGLHHFGRQALMVSVFSLIKLLAIIVLVQITGSITGAFYANMAGSFSGFCAGLFFLKKSKLKKEHVKIDRKSILKFALPVTFFALMTNVFINIDLWAVQIYIGGEYTGFYNAASILARVPYFVFFGLSATVLPGISRALAKQDLNRAKNTVSLSVRLLFMVILPVCLLSYTYGEELIVFIFGRQYLMAGRVFRLLIWGLSLLPLFSLFATILNADDKAGLVLKISLIGVVVNIASNFFLVSRFGIMGAPVATLISLSIICLLAGYYVAKRFGRLMTKTSIIRIISISVLVFIFSRFLPAEGLMAPVLFAALYFIYGVMLIITREFSIKEMLA